MQNNKFNPLILLLVISLIFSIFTLFIYGDNSLSLSARSAILYSPDNDSVVFGKNENTRLPMASTTKIMTAILAIELCNLEKIITVPPESVGVEGSSIYLKENDSISIKDLIYSVLLQSANDAAVALAYTISGDITSFSNLMNEKALEIGLCDTSFKNPHGLDEEGHFTTAYDLARLTAYALKNETFKKIASTYKYSFFISENPRIIVNHNKLLNRYDGAIGVKTGYTKKSGRCLVGAAKRDDVELISVTLDAPDDWSDHAKLLDLGFSLLESIKLTEITNTKFNLKAVGANEEYISCSINEDISLVKYKKDTVKTKTEIPKYIAAPITVGQKVGSINIYTNGILIKTVDILASQSVEATRKHKS
jgi:D-alanyl-D-alanine carboxypeptidase